ncbi:hypothetical protein ABPG75_010448 [Micractinium tetrahymenae]
MPGRPRRKHTAPQRFGTFASEQAAEQETSEEEAPTRRRRRQLSEDEGEKAAPSARRKKARKAAATPDFDEEDQGSEAAEGGSSSEGEEDSEEEQVPAARRRGGGAKRTRTAGKAAPAAAKPYVPAPPAEPRSRGDMLSLLFACPALIDALLEPDGLRTITLVARDAASLAAALGARTPEMAQLWHQLARRCDPAFSVAGSTEEALEVAQRAIRADPAHRERLNKSAAQRDYRLSQKDLSGMEFTTRPNPISYRAPPVKMYNKLDVLAVAHRRYGSAAGLHAAAQVAAAKSAKAKETRGRNVQQRREEMAAALEEEGMEGLESYRHRTNKQIQAFIKHGTGTADGIVAAMRAEEENAKHRVQREAELRVKLHEAKVYGRLQSAAAQSYIAGTCRLGLAAVVAGLKREQDEETAQAVRKERVCQLLEAEGLSGLHSWERWYGPKLPGVDDFVKAGTGTAEALIWAAKEQRAAEQARRQRSQEIDALLAAEGLQHQRWRVPGLEQWVQSGEGASGEQLVAAARQAESQQAQRVQRRQRMQELLAGEGLEAQLYSNGVDAWISQGEGSEAEAVAAARRAAQAAAQRTQRRDRLTELLAAEGIDYGLIGWEGDVRAWVGQAEGSEAAALAAARVAYEPHRQRQQRRARLVAALTAEGIDFDEARALFAVVRFDVPGLEDWLYSGHGEEAALLGAARRVHQDEVDYRQRRKAVAVLLEAEGMDILHWQRRCYELGKYLAYAEGSAEEAVAAAKRSRDMYARIEAATAAAAAATGAAAAAAAAAAAGDGPGLE